MASQLTDAFARKFYYLRLSITDVCNFRCTYCLPDGYKPGSVTNNGFLSVDEVRRVTRAPAGRPPAMTKGPRCGRWALADSGFRSSSRG